MRFVLFIVAAMLVVTATGRASAQEYPWCAEYAGGRSGGTNCGFVTLEQCRAALSGNGGYCSQNLFYRRAIAELAAPAPRKARRGRHDDR